MNITEDNIKELMRGLSHSFFMCNVFTKSSQNILSKKTLYDITKPYRIGGSLEKKY